MTHKQTHILKTLTSARTFLLILTAAGNPILAQSTDKPKTDDPPPQEVTSREVVVTATRTERELLDVPTSISIVDIKQLERKPKGTIAQILQDIPGIQVTDGGIGGGSKRVSIRGEGPARVLVLIDGMKISEQKSMDGSMIMIDQNNVERIEVIKGPASVLYGSEAIGGVINIITKKGGVSPIQGTQAFTWDGSNNSLIPYTSVYGGDGKFSYRFSGDYTDAGDKIGASGRIDNSGYMQRNWSAYMDYALRKGKMGVGYDHYWVSNRVPVVLDEGDTEYNSSMGSVIGTGRTSIATDLPDWRRDRYYAFLELEKLSDTLRKVKLSPFVQNTKKEFTNNIDVKFNALIAMGLNSKYPFYVDVESNLATFNDQMTYGANLQTDWTFGPSHYVIAGIDYIYDDLDATSKNLSGHSHVWMDRLTTPPGPLHMTNKDTSYDFFYKGSQKTMAAYVQDEWSLHPDLTATIGLRWTSFNSELSDTNDDDSAPERNDKGVLIDEATNHYHFVDPHGINPRTDSSSNLVYSAGLVYSGIQDFRLRALASTGYRYPLLNQLYVGTGMGDAGYCYPNPELKPDTSSNYEIGVRHDANGLTFDLGAFYTTAKNYITIQRLGGQTGDQKYTFGNVDSSKTYGAELALSYRHEPTNLTPYFNGVWINRKFNRGGNETDRTGLPKWNGSAGLRYEHGSASSLSFHADAYGRFTARSEEDQISESTLEVIPYPGWATFNFAFGVRKPFSSDKKRSFFADVNLNNIFNKSYIPPMSTLEDPGFHVVVRAGVNF